MNIFTEQEKIFIAQFIRNDSIICQKRGIEIKLTSEEKVRQLYLHRLLSKYNYPLSDIEVESIVNFGREKKRADIIVYKNNSPYIIIEAKNENVTDGKDQLKSYINATGAPFGVLVNGRSIENWSRKEYNGFYQISEIPFYSKDT